MQERLWAYFGSVAREHNLACLSAGGIDNHAHVLLSLPATVTILKAMQLIKGGSSKWINETFPAAGKFEWQEGYGAFSVGASQKTAVRTYIDSQAVHHGNTTFEEEYIAFLNRYGVEYDERYVFG